MRLGKLEFLVKSVHVTHCLDDDGSPKRTIGVELKIGPMVFYYDGPDADSYRPGELYRLQRVDVAGELDRTELGLQPAVVDGEDTQPGVPRAMP
jgi:hypothetical protein